MSRTISGLYAVTPDRSDTEALARQVEAAVRGGARFVQYRNKSAPLPLQLSQARRLAALCGRLGARLIVNDSIDVALESGADGVHLGRDDGDVAAARRRLGQERCIGVSCYDEIERAREAIAQGADYVAFGSFHRSPTKPSAARATLDLLRQAKRAFPTPVVAIGGIDADNAGAVIEAGADSVAVISALFDAADIESAARGIAALFANKTIQEAIR
jgi:thiamine-phosphate pyrophosphorylase